jgi:hypothetical protein
VCVLSLELAASARRCSRCMSELSGIYILVSCAGTSSRQLVLNLMETLLNFPPNNHSALVHGFPAPVSLYGQYGAILRDIPTPHLS